MPPADFSFSSSSQAVRRHLVGIGLIINLIVLSVFLGFYLRTDALLHQVLTNSARAFFDEIVVTREWLAGHQGVFVPMKPGDQISPYLLKVPGLRTTIRDEDGQVYMLKNPAVVTREISQLADHKGSFRFRITSLNLLNPENTADDFERQALKTFQQGAVERQGFEIGKNGPVFRYMSPLFIEESCLRCHGHQGYTVGDVGGGISVTVPADSITKAMRINRMYIALSVLGVILVIALFIAFIARRFIRDLNNAEAKLLELATTDALTGLLNRREGFRRMTAECSRARRSGLPLCVMMLDIDHFKAINDTWGHLTGDKVLGVLADILKKTLRMSDIVCRYGGEEFLAVLPETSRDNLEILAERLRSTVESHGFETEVGKRLHVTVSVGIAAGYGEETCDQFVARADAALYRAKTSGRNKVCGMEPVSPFTNQIS